MGENSVTGKLAEQTFRVLQESESVMKTFPGATLKESLTTNLPGREKQRMRSCII